MIKRFGFSVKMRGTVDLEVDENTSNTDIYNMIKEMVDEDLLSYEEPVEVVAVWKE